MATISVDYDSNGDIDLILREKDNTCPGQGAQQAPPASEQEKPPTYNVGPICVKVKEFRLRVSSLKLISSSSYFQAMLEGSGFCEGKELKDHGFVKIELLDPEDEPTAMMIILGILYESDVQVPIELDLSTLNKVAVVADKYQWQALVTPHATSWVGKLLPTRDLLHSLDETLLTLLWIVWIFGMKNHFKILSKIAQQNILNSIDLTDESIRLPATVLSK